MDRTFEFIFPFRIVFIDDCYAIRQLLHISPSRRDRVLTVILVVKGSFIHCSFIHCSPNLWTRTVECSSDASLQDVKLFEANCLRRLRPTNKIRSSLSAVMVGELSSFLFLFSPAPDGLGSAGSKTRLRLKGLRRHTFFRRHGLTRCPT